MAAEEIIFRETDRPIRDLGLTIAGTCLEGFIRDFDRELTKAGITTLRPHYYLSTEWGVPFNTISIAIPFYLARPDLTSLHTQRVGHIEGARRADIFGYLRHEMGHVVNYAYQLYNQEEWVKHFGSITQPYLEEYRPEPFSRRFVHHLPGWYSQKHPDEDWAETFAVWLTPGRDWQTEYADWPVALAKLAYCERTLKRLGDQEPLIKATDPDEDVADLSFSLDHYYQSHVWNPVETSPRLDGDLRVIFDDSEKLDKEDRPPRSAAALIRRMERDIMASVYRWTGHFPERTRLLLRHLAERTSQLNQVYPENKEAEVMVALTTLVTALAMNYVHYGSYMPDREKT